MGARRLACSTCNSCIICKKISARTESQRMEQLPVARVNPTPPFSTTGIDYAGPFTLKCGHTRKPVLVKSYIAVFVCFTTKAVHLELVSDLTTEAFLAALKRFVSRRGLPSVTIALISSEPRTTSPHSIVFWPPNNQLLPAVSQSELALYPRESPSLRGLVGGSSEVYKTPPEAGGWTSTARL